LSRVNNLFGRATAHLSLACCDYTHRADVLIVHRNQLPSVVVVGFVVVDERMLQIGRVHRLGGGDKCVG
jgi:hypothetical protein